MAHHLLHKHVMVTMNDRDKSRQYVMVLRKQFNEGKQLIENSSDLLRSASSSQVAPTRDFPSSSRPSTPARFATNARSNSNRTPLHTVYVSDISDFGLALSLTCERFTPSTNSQLSSVTTCSNSFSTPTFATQPLITFRVSPAHFDISDLRTVDIDLECIFMVNTDDVVEDNSNGTFMVNTDDVVEDNSNSSQVSISRSFSPITHSVVRDHSLSLLATLIYLSQENPHPFP